jgi:alpha-D-ribose 1-methylphosphonate 5-triphosphate synthase subunit PhnG
MISSMPTDQAVKERQGWLAVLAKARPATLEAAWETLADRPAYRLLRVPEIGLAMVRGRVGGTGPAFNLGEMTMTRAAVQLVEPGRAARLGFGNVAGRCPRHAELMAVLDAMLQEPDYRAAVMAQVIEPLDAAARAARAAMAAKVAATRVDFFTMVRGE